ncbi:MAG: NAD(P)/FAD-dependent oxidoreductase [Acidobacteriota bacterium]
MPTKPHVVVLGGGFGGLSTARALREAPVRVTLVDRRNHHLFQPLLYQVATGALSPANIASPLRGLFKHQSHITSLLGHVTDIDLDARRLVLADGSVPYDYLVVAPGSSQSYFGHDEWSRHAPGLKTIDNATSIRRRVLLAFERAERAGDPETIEALLTFVVVGAGPTGVELAGALAEVSHRTLKGEFRTVRPDSARVLLIEAMDRVLPPFHPSSSARARKGLESLGVTVRTGTMVTEVEAGRLRVRPTGADDDAPTETIRTSNVLWAAGVAASPLGKILATQSGAETTRSGQVHVEPDCTLPGHPEVFVIGDLAAFDHHRERPLPGLAPVAMQQGRHAARLIERRVRGEGDGDEPFRYADKGQMAVIGRSKAVAEIGRLRFGGWLAWLAWLFIHLMYLTEFENRVLVLVQWGWNYVTRGRSARLITGELSPRNQDWLPTDGGPPAD